MTHVGSGTFQQRCAWLGDGHYLVDHIGVEACYTFNWIFILVVVAKLGFLCQVKLAIMLEECLL